MTLGEFVDAVGEEAAKRGIELDRLDWTHSESFDNLRIGGRRIGDVHKGRVVVLRNAAGHAWTSVQIREAVTGLVLRIEAPR